MSYCRFGPDSDVYVVQNTPGIWECAACVIDPDVHTAFATPGEMYDHLVGQHVFKHNHMVPKHVFDLLHAEVLAAREAARPKWTPEEAEEMLAKLSLYYGEPVRKVSQYCEALRTWQRAIEEAHEREQDPHTKESFGTMVKDIRHTSLHILKSNLLERLIYRGEKLRTEPCPIHKGHWSGCAWGPGECPHCMSDGNITGWVKNT